MRWIFLFFLGHVAMDNKYLNKLYLSEIIFFPLNCARPDYGFVN